MSKWKSKLKKRTAGFERLFKKNPDVAFGAVPKPQSLEELGIGKSIFVNGQTEKVKIETIKGCIGMGNDAATKNFEINGKYSVSILDFYTQVTEDRRPTEEEQTEWDSIECVQVDVPKSAMKQKRLN